MNSLIPPFDVHHIFVAPWTQSGATYGWILLMGFLVTTSCGLVGTFLILRRMALVGDAISHSILPGLAIAFLLSNSRGSLPMFVGAVTAGIITTVLIETIHRRSRVKQDSAIGITFTTLFAIGVILITVFADKVDLDQECVLYGEIAFVPLEPFASLFGVQVAPEPVFRIALVTLAVIACIGVFYKQLLLTSFDPGLAVSLGINATFIHYALMSMLSVTVVSAFHSVGAILVVAMLIIPGATAYVLCERLPSILWLTALHAFLSSLLGLHLAIWLDCAVAGAMVVAATGLFALAWLFSPKQGVVPRLLRSRRPLSIGESGEAGAPA
jgi:manganese/zinc/iron transport system permease protein